VIKMKAMLEEALTNKKVRSKKKLEQVAVSASEAMLAWGGV
jgi:hypothetical protein